MGISSLNWYAMNRSAICWGIHFVAGRQPQNVGHPEISSPKDVIYMKSQQILPIGMTPVRGIDLFIWRQPARLERPPVLSLMKVYTHIVP